MLQVIYVSSKAPSAVAIDLDELLVISRRNNAKANITGLLYADGQRFLQVVEGPEASINRLLARIASDDRHRAMVTLSRRTIAAREFGQWSMARMGPGENGRSFLSRIEELCGCADPRVVGTFVGFVQARSAMRT